ncbi:MAG: Hpt domain-containing protein [Lachnospiraceae bacterium]|nr:Hpt domain-containing protein [Lachnospiraceae bacterium]
MKLTECYANLDGDFAGVRSRLIREASISKFLIMFLKDTQYQEFHASVEAGDWENAFRNIHTLKGTCLNLGISKLARISSDITEMLRGGAPSSDISGNIEELDKEYEKTVEIIRNYSENPETE